MEYQSFAPDEIAEPTATVVAAFESAADNPQAVFTDEGAIAAIQELTVFEAEACGLESPQAAVVNEIDPDAVRVDVTASEYTFDLADPTAAGRYSFVMVNAGVEPHLLAVAQLEPEVALSSSGSDQRTFCAGLLAPGAPVCRSKSGQVVGSRSML